MTAPFRHDIVFLYIIAKEFIVAALVYEDERGEKNKTKKKKKKKKLKSCFFFPGLLFIIFCTRNKGKQPREGKQDRRLHGVCIDLYSSSVSICELGGSFLALDKTRGFNCAVLFIVYSIQCCESEGGGS